MRAKFGIDDMESVGKIGNFCSSIENPSPRHGKVSDNAGMNYVCWADLPKLDVAGSIPVARSKILPQIYSVPISIRSAFYFIFPDRLTTPPLGR